MDLNDCIPRDKHDSDAVARAEEVGFPALNPILPELLEWLQDTNWPVATPMTQLLLKAGPEIGPHVVAVFRSDDDIWKYWILVVLARSWSDDLFDVVRPEIERIAISPTPSEDLEGVADEAREVLTLRGQSF